MTDRDCFVRSELSTFALHLGFALQIEELNEERGNSEKRNGVVRKGTASEHRAINDVIRQLFYL